VKHIQRLIALSAGNTFADLQLRQFVPRERPGQA